MTFMELKVVFVTTDNSTDSQQAKFFIVLIMAAPVDKSVMSHTNSCCKVLDLAVALQAN